MEETIFREKKRELITYWALTGVFIVASGVLSDWTLRHPASLLLIVVAVLALDASFQTWAYIKHPYKIVINESGIHVYYRSFTLSSNYSFWKDSYKVYHWENIKNVYLNWDDSISRNRLYETFIIVENEQGNLSTVWISGISYNRNRLAESINNFSGGKCSFDYETTAINSKKRFGLCFWTTILPLIIGIVLCEIIIKCTKG